MKLALLSASLLMTVGLFWVGPSAKASTIYTLQPNDGAYPEDRLVPDGEGGFYGTTDSSNKNGMVAYGLGTIFHLGPPAMPHGAWSYTVLHNFIRDDGKDPRDLVLAPDGVLFGTAYRGGVNNNGKRAEGTVFSLSPPTQSGKPWKFEVLKAFRRKPGGPNAIGGLMRGRNGSLYGITLAGGTHNYGMAYRLSSRDGQNWHFKDIHDFTPTESEFWTHISGLTGNPKTGLFGVAFVGGGTCQDGCGSVYELLPGAGHDDQWSFRLIYQFQDVPDGSTPIGPLVQDASGTLFGVTSEGGAANHGEVYSLKPVSQPKQQWVKTDLYDFPGGLGGDTPSSGLAIDADGTIYGNTLAGGVPGPAPCQMQGCGTVFRLSPPTGTGAWNFTLLYAFGAPPDGGFPVNDQPTIFGSHLYGLTKGGGVGCQAGNNPLDCFGTIYRVER